MYIDKIDDIVGEHNTTYKIIKMKPVHVKDKYVILRKKLMIKILN